VKHPSAVLDAAVSGLSLVATSRNGRRPRAVIRLDNTLDARRDLKGTFHREGSEGNAGTR